ncbi:MAG: hypothetical protein HGA98_00125, partial [Deltaproteobacteria bacterium]|nr:hypothetical protein [Deltaproteobacteria bacterium]
MRRRTLGWCALLGALLAAAAAGAGEAKPSFAPAPVLARLEKVAAAVKTLSGDFVQEKHLSVFREVMV